MQSSKAGLGLVVMSFLAGCVGPAGAGDAGLIDVTGHWHGSYVLMSVTNTIDFTFNADGSWSELVTQVSSSPADGCVLTAQLSGTYTLSIADGGSTTLSTQSMGTVTIAGCTDPSRDMTMPSTMTNTFAITRSGDMLRLDPGAGGVPPFTLTKQAS